MGQSVSITTSNSDWTALQSCEEWALTLSRTPSSFPITQAQARLLPQAMRAVQASLLPAPAKQMTVEIARLVEWARAFSIPAPDVETAVTSYRAALRHLPSDLLAQAFETVKANHKWGMRLPLPADLATTAQGELSKRLRVKAGLIQASRQQVEDNRGPPSEDEKRRVTELLSQWREVREIS